MGTIIVNAVGEQCPIPVVKATRALRAMTEPGILEVHVDNEIAVQNLTRMAAGHNLTARWEKTGESAYVVAVEVPAPVGEVPLEEPELVTHLYRTDSLSRSAASLRSVRRWSAPGAMGRQFAGGFTASALAMPTLWRWTPENSWGKHP